MTAAACIIAVALLGGIWDIKTTRIPNWLSGTGITAGLIIGYLEGNLILSVLGLFAGAVLLLPFVLKGGMGAGDLKMTAALGALGGPFFALRALLFGSILGALSALLVVVHKRTGFLERYYRAVTVEEGSKMPYGIYIALGALSALGGVLIA